MSSQAAKKKDFFSQRYMDVRVTRHANTGSMARRVRGAREDIPPPRRRRATEASRKVKLTANPCDPLSQFLLAPIDLRIFV
jgi:hypothetical protein